jgi:hypothetical protein
MRRLREHEARECHLMPLTVGYRPDEGWMLENVLHDFRGCDRRAAVVLNSEGYEEVWVEPIPGFSEAGSVQFSGAEPLNTEN